MPLLIVQHRSPSYSSRTLKLYHCALPHLLGSLRFSFKVTEASGEIRFKESSELTVNMSVLYRYIRQVLHLFSSVMLNSNYSTASQPFSFPRRDP